MQREDLKSRIIPTVVENTNESQEMGDEKFNTTDLIYLDSYDDQQYDLEYSKSRKKNVERKISATDYAKMNNAYTYDVYETRTGKKTTVVGLRTAVSSNDSIYCVSGEGSWSAFNVVDRYIGICPSLHYQLPKEGEKIDIREVKDKRRKTIYYTLQIGEYVKTKVDEDLSKTLELLYHGGKIREGILPTGRWYSCNGQREDNKEYAGKHSPEFEYQGNRYARVVSSPYSREYKYSDGTTADKTGTVRWVKVEPISFVIRNWTEMPKWINPKGNGKAKYFDLRAEEVIASNIPFYPKRREKNSTMWQNSSIRGFLNGIDVESISTNGNPEYGATGGGNFTGECNFLNEAFNLSRQPMVEYTIPNSEVDIPDDAFNGCITLKKIIMHDGIKSIGKRAFEGLDFKYAYRTKTGRLVFSQELPKNKSKYQDKIELDKIVKALEGFDYSILVQKDKFGEIAKLAEELAKKKVSVPYVYAATLVQSGKSELLCKNSDFRFFNNEIPGINDKLLDFPIEERIAFYKFARSLGCFSTSRMLDKRGKETEVILAQKASSLLANLLKTNGMALR